MCPDFSQGHISLNSSHLWISLSQMFVLSSPCALAVCSFRSDLILATTPQRDFPALSEEGPQVCPLRSAHSGTNSEQRVHVHSLAIALQRDISRLLIVLKADHVLVSTLSLPLTCAYRCTASLPCVQSLAIALLWGVFSLSCVQIRLLVREPARLVLPGHRLRMRRTQQTHNGPFWEQPATLLDLPALAQRGSSRCAEERLPSNNSQQEKGQSHQYRALPCCKYSQAQFKGLCHICAAALEI